MKSPRFLLIAALLVLASTLAGCAGIPVSSKKAPPAVEELHERLSVAIRNNGFSHGIHSVREDDRDIDSIFVSIPLDSLKRRHLSLDLMLTDVARLCAKPQFADVEVQIEIGVHDEEDARYMRSLIEPQVQRAANVKVLQVKEARNELTITMTHGQGVAPRR